jgi:NADH dehydrogenase
MKIVITGANSSVGKNLLKQLSDNPEVTVIAGVRSKSAFASLPTGSSIVPRVIAYDDQPGLTDTLQGADCVIHLAGILIESKHSNYASANVAATEAVLNAAKASSVKHFIFISVVGAAKDSNNAYFRSKGTAEQLVIESGIPASILRTPILLGIGSAGSYTLTSAIAKGKSKVLGGGNYTMRPLDVDDLNNALIKLTQKAVTEATVYELVGPESIAYKDLIKLAGKTKNVDIAVGTAPIWLAKLVSAVTSMIKGGGISPTVIDVITMNEVIEKNSDRELGITLTPLQDTLNKILAENK